MKPKKKECKLHGEGNYFYGCPLCTYNKVIDDYEAHLPSEEEIREIMLEDFDELIGSRKEQMEVYECLVIPFAKALNKRIRGE